MSDTRHIVIQPPVGTTSEQARDARARGWAYAFECFNRRANQEGGPATAPDNEAKGPNNARPAKTMLPSCLPRQ
jgi:hypothetical protein